MLLNRFFSIESVNVSGEGNLLTSESNKFLVQVRVYPDHPIFNGHFPGNPVIPGVCQVQIVTEILNEIYHKCFRLINADNIKFLSLINPVVTGSFSFNLNCRPGPADDITVYVVAFKDQITFLKLKASYSSTNLNV